MKKLNYLFVAIMFFVFTACGGSETATKEASQSLQESIEIADVSTCNEECQKACCLGFQGHLCRQIRFLQLYFQHSFCFLWLL